MKNEDCLISPTLRKRLEVQGYVGFSDKKLKNFEFGIRLAYILCLSIVIVGLLTTNIYILGAAMVIAFFGIFPPYHPFDYLYNGLLRHLMKKPKLPKRTNQTRFACTLATIWLAVTIYLFITGYNLWGYIVGYNMVAVALLVSTTHICIPSMIYNFLFLKKKALSLVKHEH